MTNINILLQNKKYTFPCPENEKEEVLKLAKKLDSRIKSISENINDNLDSETLIILASLMAEAELMNSKKDLEKLEENKLEEDDIYDSITENIENITDYIKTLTKKIDKY